MNKPDFEIIPEYRFKTHLKFLFFSIGSALIITSLIIEELSVLIFIGFIVLIIGGLQAVFTSKKYLRIFQDTIEIETKSIVKEFSETLTIYFKDIEGVFYKKKQIILSNIFATYGVRVVNDYRIFFKLKENKSKLVWKIGRKEEFYKAFQIIEEKVSSLS